jgi:hypothetical protein
MSMVNQSLADATVRILGNNVRLINWFREVENKFDGITDSVENKLGKIDKLLKDGKHNEAIDEVEFADLLKTLRSSRRSEYGRVRNAMIWMIGQILKLKRIPADDRPRQAIVNMIEVFRTLYIILLNEHIENTTMIEDKIVFQIERMTTDSARIYDLGMRPYVESDETKKSIKGASDQNEDREKALTQSLELQPQGLANILG